MSFRERAAWLALGVLSCMAAGPAMAGTTQNGSSGVTVSRNLQITGSPGCTVSLNLTQTSGGNWLDAGGATGTIVTDILDFGSLVLNPVTPSATYGAVYRDSVDDGYNVPFQFSVNVASTSCQYNNFTVTAQNLSGPYVIVAAGGNISDPTSRSVLGGSLLIAGNPATTIAGLSFPNQTGTPFAINQDALWLLDDPVTGVQSTTLQFTLIPAF